ncbi:MAG: sigma-54-dependent Fis family transcriptional regulator [Deltaproteobacteria bacterium]|nr:sigma-54-dependent Fis family transcriptional regulator [Deltaproteobacteria bacterium]
MFQGKILIVDDDRGILDMLILRLSKKGYDVKVSETAEAAFRMLSAESFDVVLTDLHMPGVDGIQLTERIRDSYPDVPVIVITSFGSMETAVASLRAGAYDFVTKPFEIEILRRALERAVGNARLQKEVNALKETVEKSVAFQEIHGNSSAMARVFSLIEKAARSDASVLITGESGTGKELIARALHHRSRRSTGPFVAINCSAMPENLLESEFFGHTRGAFTDAKDNKIGLFAEADRGTVFLDEIGDMPLGLQPKILRTLEQRTVRPVGGRQEIGFDARIVAATNRDLGVMVEEQRFREDLYYRFNVIHIHAPPLRERGQDVLLLAHRFLSQFSQHTDLEMTGFSRKAEQLLMDYHWPGNVRELRNCIERAVALASETQIKVRDLPERVQNYQPSQVLVTSNRPQELVTLDEVERRYIQRVLEVTDNNKALAARILGLDRKTLYRKLERCKLE